MGRPAGDGKPAQPLTAEEARSVSFQQSPLAWRGYSEQEVDAFVARAAEALDEAKRESAALRAEVDRLRNFYRNNDTDIDRGVDRPESWSGRVAPSELIVAAQRYAKTQLEHADLFAEMVAVNGRENSEETLVHARMRARILAEELVRDHLARGDDRHRTQGELYQLVQWTRAMGEAMWTQTETMAAVVESALEQPAP